MPKRFDIAIKVLTAEKHRIIGKFCEEVVEKSPHVDPTFTVRATAAKHLNEAIEILAMHHRNKYV